MLSHGGSNSQALISHWETNVMITSLSLLTRHLFDYAGLFPPAKLDLDTALKNYLQYLKHPQKNILGKFILPVALISDAIKKLGSVDIVKCSEGDMHVQVGEERGSWRAFSILLSQSKKLEDIPINLKNDFSHITSIQKNVASFEICFPHDFYNLSEEKIFYYFDLLIKNVQFNGIHSPILAPVNHMSIACVTDTKIGLMPRDCNFGKLKCNPIPKISKRTPNSASA
jgi:hypothetical protein